MTGTPLRSVVVMGVSGVGKSSVARELAAALGWAYEDADAYHPPANVAKMARGEALDDTDRAPWLARLRELLAERAASGGGTVLACSALKRRYRRTLARCETPAESGDAEGAGSGPCAPEILFAWLDAPRDVVAERLQSRPDHFFDPELLDSQYAALEPPAAGERPPVLRLDATAPLDAVIAEAERAVRARAEAGRGAR